MPCSIGLFLVLTTGYLFSLQQLPLLRQVKEFRLPRPLPQVEPAEGHTQVKPPRPRDSRIPVEHVSVGGVLWLVRVPAHNDMEGGGLRIEIKLLKIVQNIKGRGLSFDDCGRGQRCRPIRLINVSSHSHDGSESLQGIENPGLSHVAGMNDQIRSSQREQCFISQQAMCVRDQPDTARVHLVAAHSIPGRFTICSGFTRALSTVSPQWRCGPVTRPVAPTFPRSADGPTSSPAFTEISERCP